MKKAYFAPVCVIAAVFLILLSILTPACKPAPDQNREPWQLPPDLKNSATEEEAANFAWETFVAISWPGAYDQPGQPLKTEPFGADGPTVWETWVEVFDMFHDPLNPPKWADPNRIPQNCGDLGAGSNAKVIHETSKVSDLLVERDQAVGGAIVDVNGKIARYEVRVNEPMFDFITYNELNRADKQAIFPEEKFVFPNGSIEIKAAWKVMPEDKNTWNRYHIAEAMVYDREIDDTTVNTDCLPESVIKGMQGCRTETMGLVGLHVVYRIPSAPMSVWMTFEQVDNVDDSPEGVTPSFYDPDCPPGECPPNQRFCDDPNQAFTQITRQTPIPDVVKAVNAKIQASELLKGTKWEFYKLVGIQYPTSLDGGRIGKQNRAILANTTMETLNQTASSCVGCHAFARSSNPTKLSDFSWMMARAKVPQPNVLDKNSTTADLIFHITNPKANPYQKWKTWPDDQWNIFSKAMGGENPHGKSVRLYVNDVAYDYAIDENGKPRQGIKKELPVGSIIVKENYKVPFPVTPQTGDLVELTVMWKQEDAPGPNNWNWVKTTPFGTRVDNMGADPSCYSCHNWQGSGDFMLLFNFGDTPVIRTNLVDQRLREEFERKHRKSEAEVEDIRAMIDSN